MAQAPAALGEEVCDFEGDKPYYAIECEREDTDCLQRKRERETIHRERETIHRERERLSTERERLSTGRERLSTERESDYPQRERERLPTQRGRDYPQRERGTWMVHTFLFKKG